LALALSLCARVANAVLAGEAIASRAFLRGRGVLRRPSLRGGLF
jgi:hypothetical protein